MPPMKVPSDVHVDQVITKLVVGRRPQGYIADDVMPIIDVENQSDLYPIFGDESFKPLDGHRAYGAAAVEIGWTYSTTPYACEQYSARIFNARKTRANADNFLRISQRDAQLIQDRLSVGKEARVAGLCTDAAVITQNETLAGATQWSHASGDPVADVMAAKETIFASCGNYPNVMVLPRLVRAQLRLNVLLRAALSITRDTYSVTDADLLNAFELDRILVPRSLYNTADEGQTVALTDIWGDYALLAYVNPNPSPAMQEMSFGYQFTWYDWYAETDYEKDRDADWTQMTYDNDEKVTCPTAAWLFRDCVA